MALTAGEIQRLHSAFGSVDEILDRRRAIYRLTLQMAGVRTDDRLPDEVLSPAVVDSPAVRAHLADVLSGTRDLDMRQVRALDEPVVVPGDDTTEASVRLAATPTAARDLRGALDRLGAELDQPDFAVDPDALVLASSDAFGPVMRTVVEGVELAFDIAPELVGDLVPHVALLAVLNADAAGRLGSASVREFPGLVLLPEPRTPLEVAEAIVHEGAHQKFFDLAMTRSILATPPAERFSPPWSSEGAMWPFEQCVAAFHAYCCLSAFAAEVPGDVELHDHSLLPAATARADMIGSWLTDHGNAFGNDGQAFIGGLNRSSFAIPPAPGDVGEALVEMNASPERVARRRCGDRTLVMQLTRPALVLWVPTEAIGPN